MKILPFLKPDSLIGFLGALFITTLTTIICINYVDNSVVSYFNQYPLTKNNLISFVLSIPIIIGVFSIIYILTYTLALYKNVETHCYRDMFYISVTYMVAVSVKNFLKIVFGRTWPNQQPSFFPDDNISRGVKEVNQLILEGFHPFTGLREFASFPSGSTSISICYVVMLALLFPKTRIPAFIVGISIPTLMVLTNIHYVSDVIAGVFVGFATALLSLKVTNRK